MDGLEASVTVCIFEGAIVGPRIVYSSMQSHDYKSRRTSS
jgi:hypothetical protein